MTVKLTKNELRAQQVRLSQLERYLPTLQLKKAMLQTEVYGARLAIGEREAALSNAENFVQTFAKLMAVPLAVDLRQASVIQQVRKHYENVAGVEIPQLEGVDFEPFEYSLFDTPPWAEGAIKALQAQSVAEVELDIAEETLKALERELREVSIRVNLFEKILIPRALQNIKKIKVFLGDQELAAVSQAKVAKTKILKREAARR